MSRVAKKEQWYNLVQKIVCIQNNFTQNSSYIKVDKKYMKMYYKSYINHLITQCDDT